MLFRSSRSRSIPALTVLIVLVGAGFGALYLKNRLWTPKSVFVEDRDTTIPDRPKFVPEVKTDAGQVSEVKGEYVIQIDKLNVKAPIIPNVDGIDEVLYLKALEKGVAHYKGTPLPGNKGNSFIFGHSSYYANKPGSYKEIFKTLGDLKVGDEMKIVHGSETFVYKIFVSKKVADDDGSVLDETKDEVLTISTCWPPGTYAKRWIVQGKRV